MSLKVYERISILRRCEHLRNRYRTRRTHRVQSRNIEKEFCSEPIKNHSWRGMQNETQLSILGRVLFMRSSTESTRGITDPTSDCTSTAQKHSWVSAYLPVAMRAKRRQRIQLICFGVERSFFSIPGTRKNRNNLIQTRKTHHFQCHYKSFNVEISCGDSPSSVIDTDPEGRTECNPEI